MTNVTDIADMRNKRKSLEKKAAKIRGGSDKLTRGELSDAFLESANLVEQQHALMEALTNDILMLAKTYTEMQHQVMMISGQAFLALDVLKEKGLITPDELQARWDSVVQKKIEEATKNLSS